MNFEDFIEVNHLKKVRISKNLPQWQLSVMAEINTARISQIERGAPTRGREREKLAGALGIAIEGIWPEDTGE